MNPTPDTQAARAAAEPFCTVPTDEELQACATLKEVIEDFLPGNYIPTPDQAEQLADCAARAAIRWQALHPTSLLKQPEWEPFEYSVAITLFGRIQEERWSTVAGIYQVRTLGEIGQKFQWAILGKHGPVDTDSLEAAKSACWLHYVAAMEKAFV